MMRIIIEKYVFFDASREDVLSSQLKKKKKKHLSRTLASNFYFALVLVNPIDRETSPNSLVILFHKCAEMHAGKSAGVLKSEI